MNFETWISIIDAVKENRIRCQNNQENKSRRRSKIFSEVQLFYKIFIFSKFVNVYCHLLKSWL
jgi:hypothetical protein